MLEKVPIFSLSFVINFAFGFLYLLGAQRTALSNLRFVIISLGTKEENTVNFLGHWKLLLGLLLSFIWFWLRK